VGRRYRDVEDLGVKKGPFYVLFLSSMPSILFETGFLTNRSEAARLRNQTYLDHVADELARAISMYRDQVGTRVARGAP
jgi:N-acetylmuramoyl-L-alanine amidase